MVHSDWLDAPVWRQSGRLAKYGAGVRVFSQLDQAEFFMPCLSARGPVGLARRIIARFLSLSQTLALRVAGFGLVVSDLLRCS